MVVINLAYTEQINPSGASPVLTREQIWRGLQRKIRKAQDFVPVIESTDVIEEKGNEITRVAHFKGQNGKPGFEVKEMCREFPPTKVEFHQPDGALILNTISDGPSLTESEYNMTYTFEWRYPDVAENSEEHHRLYKQQIQMAKMAVHSSIEAIRRLASQGELD